jgi:hypothetical protein
VKNLFSSLPAFLPHSEKIYGNSQMYPQQSKCFDSGFIPYLTVEKTGSEFVQIIKQF